MPRPVMTSPQRNSLTDRAGRGSVDDRAVTLMARSAWPKIVKRLRRGGLGVLKFASRQTCRECGEHRASGILDIDGEVAMDAIVNPIKEGASAVCCQVGAWMPS